MSQCETFTGAGLDPGGERRCHRRATKRCVDDDGETFKMCGHCARMFEGGMAEVRDLPAPRRRVRRTNDAPTRNSGGTER